MNNELTKEMIPQLIGYFMENKKASIPKDFFYAHREEILDKLDDFKYILHEYPSVILIRSYDYPFKDYDFADYIFMKRNMDALNKIISGEVVELPEELFAHEEYVDMYLIYIATEIKKLMEMCDIEDIDEAIDSVSGFYYREIADNILETRNLKGELI